MKGVRKGKGNIVFDESGFPTPGGIRDRFKFPRGFKGFEQRRGGGCDGLTGRTLVRMVECTTKSKTHFYRIVGGTGDPAHVAFRK